MKAMLPSAEQLTLDWTNNPRWAGITRPYAAEDVVRLVRGDWRRGDANYAVLVMISLRVGVPLGIAVHLA